jgi:hypothetical protein
LKNQFQVLLFGIWTVILSIALKIIEKTF